MEVANLAERKSNIQEVVMEEEIKEMENFKPSSSKQPKKIKVIITSNMHPEQKDVFVGFNGKGYLIQLGVPVEIPFELYKILMNAKIKQRRADNKSEYYVQRFNVQIIDWF